MPSCDREKQELGRMVSELAVKTRHGVTILEIRNEENTALGMVRNVSQSIVTGDTVIGKGDILYLVGRKEGMEELEREWGLERHPVRHRPHARLLPRCGWSRGSRPLPLCSSLYSFCS